MDKKQHDLYNMDTQGADREIFKSDTIYPSMVQADKFFKFSHYYTHINAADKQIFMTDNYYLHIDGADRQNNGSLIIIIYSRRMHGTHLKYSHLIIIMYTFMVQTNSHT